VGFIALLRMKALPAAAEPAVPVAPDVALGACALRCTQPSTVIFVALDVLRAGGVCEVLGGADGVWVDGGWPAGL
jgi:hypothetical protein